MPSRFSGALDRRYGAVQVPYGHHGRRARQAARGNPSRFSGALDRRSGLCRFHTVTTGGGRGKPLMLFLHGFPELWYSWRRQLEHLADDFEVDALPRPYRAVVSGAPGQEIPWMALLHITYRRCTTWCTKPLVLLLPMNCVLQVLLCKSVVIGTAIQLILPAH